MSNIFVTENGFNGKTLAEIKVELETDFQAIWGNDIDLSAEGFFGQLIGYLSKNFSDFYDGAEEIYNSRDPDRATGISLDAIVAENYISRLPAKATQVDSVQLFSDTEGTLVPAFKLARQENTTIDYFLQTDVTITKTNATQADISVDDLQESYIYSIIINSISYTYLSQVSDTEIDILNGLKTVIDAGSWVGSTIVDTTNEIIILLDTDTPFSFNIDDKLAIEQFSSPGSFECVTTGVNTLPANTLTIIQTAVSGWIGINNPIAGVTGRAKETDEELRIRRETTIIQGNSTDIAIQTGILNDVDDVITAKVTSNRGDVTDGEGRPPHSFEAVVEGGVDEDIAEKIFEKQPAGIQSYGNTTIIIQDSEGVDQTIKFSRPEPVYIWVEVSRDFYDEENYPTNGDTLIKEAIVEWSLDNLTVATDVIRQRLNIPIYTIPGIKDTLIKLDGTANPGDTPSYAFQNITIDDREIAVFSTDRIVIQDIP